MAFADLCGFQLNDSVSANATRALKRAARKLGADNKSNMPDAKRQRPSGATPAAAGWQGATNVCKRCSGPHAAGVCPFASRPAFLKHVADMKKGGGSAPKCYNCGESGHIGRDCPKNKK